MEHSENKDSAELWKELLESINRQREVNTKLIKILEQVIPSSRKGEGPSLTEELETEIKDLVVEAESLQAEERAAFHQLFGADEEAE